MARYPKPAPDGPALAYAPAFTSAEAARAWLRAERENLEAAHARALTFGLHGHAIALALGLAEILRTDGPFTRALELQQSAAEAAERHGRPAAHASALTNLGIVRCLTGDLAGATDALSRALEIHRATGNRQNQAWALNHYAATIAATGDLPRALALYQQAVTMNRELNKPDDEAIAHEGLGECHLSTGETEPGTAHLHQALEIFQRLGMAPDASRVQDRLDRLTAGL
jgi:tetratricopeptide (TPR) repeat protein